MLLHLGSGFHHWFLILHLNWKNLWSCIYLYKHYAQGWCACVGVKQYFPCFFFVIYVPNPLRNVCLCCYRYVCAADTACAHSKSVPPAFSSRAAPQRWKTLTYQVISASAPHAWSQNVRLTVCPLRWQRWWLPVSGAIPAAVGWFCRSPPSWGCAGFSKTGRCRSHLYDGWEVRKGQTFGMISPTHSCTKIHSDTQKAHRHKRTIFSVCTPPTIDSETSQINRWTLMKLPCLLQSMDQTTAGCNLANIVHLPI